jgi:hypothetical protein
LEQEHKERLEEWLRLHKDQADALAREYGGAVRTAEKLEQSPDSPNAPDSFGGRYFIAGANRFETNDEASLRRVRYVICGLSGRSGCGGPLSNRYLGAQVEIMAFMKRREELDRLGMPRLAVYVRCTSEGTLKECPTEARCYGGPWLETPRSPEPREAVTPSDAGETNPL